MMFAAIAQISLAGPARRRAHSLTRSAPVSIRITAPRTKASRNASGWNNGPAPEICTFGTAAQESEAVGRWLADRLLITGVDPASAFLEDLAP
jgi:hypothetical protein